MWWVEAKYQTKYYQTIYYISPQRTGDIKGGSKKTIFFFFGLLQEAIQLNLWNFVMMKDVYSRAGQIALFS